VFGLQKAQLGWQKAPLSSQAHDLASRSAISDSSFLLFLFLFLPFCHLKLVALHFIFLFSFICVLFFSLLMLAVVLGIGEMAPLPDPPELPLSGAFADSNLLTEILNRELPLL
jgi:hypothetical protein